MRPKGYKTLYRLYKKEGRVTISLNRHKDSLWSGRWTLDLREPTAGDVWSTNVYEERETGVIVVRRRPNKGNRTLVRTTSVKRNLVVKLRKR